MFFKTALLSIIYKYGYKGKKKIVICNDYK